MCQCRCASEDARTGTCSARPVAPARAIPPNSCSPFFSFSRACVAPAQVSKMSLNELSACFEGALPAAVTAVCASAGCVAAACQTSITVYEVSRAANGVNAPAFESSVVVSTSAATRFLRFVGDGCLASADGSHFIYIWAVRNWQLPAAGALPASVTMAGCCAAVLCGHDDEVTCLVADAASGRMLSAAADGSVCCWSTRGFDCELRIKSNLGVTALCCSDKVICSADASKTVKVWSATSGACVKEISVGRDIGGVCCSPGVLFVSVSRQMCIPFSLSTFAADQQLCLPVPPDSDSPLTHMCMCGGVVTALAGARVVALIAGGHLEQLHLNRIPVTCHDAADGLIVVAHAPKNAVCVFYIEPFLGELAAQLQLPQVQYLENVRSANAKVASTGKNLDIQVTTTGVSHISSVVNVGGMLYIGHHDGCLQCFQTFSSGVAKRLFSCQAHEDIVACSAVLQLKTSDTIATGSGDGCVKLWGQSDGQLLGEIEIGVGVCSMCIHQGCAVIGLEDGVLLRVEVDGKYRLKVAGEMRGHVRVATASNVCRSLLIVFCAFMFSRS